MPSSELTLAADLASDSLADARPAEAAGYAASTTSATSATSADTAAV